MITLKKKSLSYEEYCKGKTTKKAIDPKYLYFHLNDCVQIEEGFTLRNLFNHIEKGELLQILSPIYNCDIGLLIKESNNKRPTNEPLDYLIIQQYISLFTKEKGSTCQPDTQFAGKKNRNKDNWGIGLSPISQLVDLPVRISDTAEVMVYHDRTWTNHTKYKTRLELTLNQFLLAIFEELSFYGSDENKVSMISSLKQSMDDIDSGKAKTVPWNEMMKKLKKKK